MKTTLEIHCNLDLINAIDNRFERRRRLKSAVASMTKFIKSAVKDFRVIFIEAEGRSTTEFELILNNPAVEKFSVESLRRFVNVFVYSNEGRKILLRRLPGSRELVDAFASNAAIEAEAVNKAMSMNALNVNYGMLDFYGTAAQLFSYMSSVAVSSWGGSWTTRYNVYVVPTKEWFCSILDLKGRMVADEPLESLPEEMTVFSGADDLASVFVALKTMFETGAAERGAARVTASSVNKISRSLICRPFFESDDREAAQWRLSLLANLIGFAPASSLETVKEFLRAVPDNMAYIVDQQVIGPFVPHLRGLSTTTESKPVKAMVSVFMAQMRKRAKSTGWLSVDRLIDDCLSQYGPQQLLGTIDKFSPTKLKSKLTGSYVDFTDLHRSYVVPFHRGMLMLLAACGIVDIAYDHTAPAYSFADGIRRFRLTDIGRYVFGVTDDVELPDSRVDDSLFEIDPDHLIINNLSDNNPYLVFLERLGRNIGGRRYVLEAAKVIHKERNVEALQYIIGQFEKYVTGPRDKLSPVWQGFYSELRQRIPEISGVLSMDYDIIRLNPDDKLLIDAIINDPEIRKIVNLAENYLILIKRSDRYDFNLRLSKLGFRPLLTNH